jgi:putative peptidoglycan lipid II flippase
VPALSSAFFNLGSIVGVVSLALLFARLGMSAIAGMAWGTLIGGLLQLLIQLPTLKQSGFRLLPSLRFNDPGLKKVLRLMLPATIGLSATQINIFVNTNFAASCAQGSVSWLNYAFRMVQLPIGVFGVAISIAATPVMARCAARKDITGLRQTFVSSLVMVFSLTIPATVGLILLARPIIRLIFEHGVFTGFDTSQTAAVLTCYAYGLLALGYTDLVMEAGLGRFDYLALVPVIEGAGGCISDWQGEALTFDSAGQALASANPALHAQALHLIASAQ